MGLKKKVSTVDKVFELAKPLADELGLEIWDIRFEKEGVSWYLRVFIDKDGGVGLEDCEAISRPLNKLLDEIDPIDVGYVFEVGSTGLGRELKKEQHFQKFLGSIIKVRLIHTENSAKEVVGTLKSFDNGSFLLVTSLGDELEIKLSDCAFVKLNDDENLFE